MAFDLSLYLCVSRLFSVCVCGLCVKDVVDYPKLVIQKYIVKNYHTKSEVWGIPKHGPLSYKMVSRVPEKGAQKHEFFALLIGTCPTFF